MQPPSFFELKQKSDMKEQEDWEYLSNPEGQELNEDQKKFVNQFYFEYADKDPFYIMNWLHEKALGHQLGEMAAYVFSLEENFGMNVDESLSDEEYDQEEDQDREDEFDSLFGNFVEPFAKQEDLQYLRYNRVKTSKSTHLTKEESKKIREKLTRIKAKNEIKRQHSAILSSQKQMSSYKDVDIKVLQKAESKRKR